MAADNVDRVSFLSRMLGNELKKITPRFQGRQPDRDTVNALVDDIVKTTMVFESKYVAREDQHSESYLRSYFEPVTLRVLGDMGIHVLERAS